MTGGAQSLSALRISMALDPTMRVLIAHGMFDLLTPYFGTVLIVRQIPDLGAPDRIRMVVYPGGHMFYTQNASRAAFREEARKLILGQ
jgi:carboxypeptidase C (cathepsin A)